MIVSNAYEHAPVTKGEAMKVLVVDVGGTSFTYRRLGAEAGAPVIFAHHLPDRRMAI